MSEHEKFLKSLAAAQSRPGDAPGENAFSDGFPMPGVTPELLGQAPRTDVNVNPRTNLTDARMRVRRRVFLIFRDWEMCKRCEVSIKDGSVNLPAVGDYTCPHVQLEDYHKIVDACARGDFILNSDSEVTSKEGLIYASVQWFEPIIAGPAQRRPQRQAGPLAPKKDTQ